MLKESDKYMKVYNFKKIDAFAAKTSSGNPAGYILLDSPSEISNYEMLRIAKELKGFVNEVGYVSRVSEDTFNLKFYSSEREVDLCGHATIAIMYDLLSTNEELRKVNPIFIETNRGKLIVENKIEEEDAVFIMAPEPIETHKLPAIQSIADSLKINIEEINGTYPLSIINAGLTTLIVPVRTLDSILAINPDFEELKNFCVNAEIDIIEVFTGDVVGKNSNYRTRVFAPRFGYMEDPATGSGNSALGYYLVKNKMWETSSLVIEQNGFRDEYNIVKLNKKIDEQGNCRVLFGGGAVTRIEGKYILH
jgi:PhzF family phenazine biosynthesis protein